MKYIGLDITHGKGDGALTKRLIITFPDDLVHADVSQMMHHLALRTFPKAQAVKVATAGSVTVRGRCSGRSESLNIGSQPVDDTKCLNFADYGGNYL